MAIASGKGGTGKTLIATNLAAVTGAVLVDLDVEEPNCHLFFDGAETSRTPVFRPVPKVDLDKCTRCGNCAKVCEFRAIAVLPDEVLVFKELCHGCGACTMFCPEGAIEEIGHMVGEVICADGGVHKLLYGRLKVGEASGLPLVRRVKSDVPRDSLAIIDCPPGTACPAVESIRGSDFCVLVTEPTPFGLHDLKLALEMVSKLRVRYGVYINKQGLEGPDIAEFCRARNVPVLGELEHSRGIAVRYSKGELLTDEPRYRERFESLMCRINEEGLR